MTLINDLRNRIRVRRGEPEEAGVGAGKPEPEHDRAAAGTNGSVAAFATSEAEGTHRGMPAIDEDSLEFGEEPRGLEPGEAARLARSSVAVEPKNEKQRREAARALGRLLSGLEDHQRHQTKVLRYLEPIPDLTTTATELRRDAARLLEAAGDSRDHARTVERRVESGLATLGERHTSLEQSLARLNHDVETLGRTVREQGETSEHVRAGLSMVHERTERLNESLSRMARLLEDGDAMMRRRIERQNRVLIAAVVVLGLVGVLGLLV